MSPGPSLAVVLNSTLRGGRGHGLQASIAHGFGVGLYGLLTVTGLAVLVANSPTLFLAIQLAGAAYLLYLGISALGSKGAAIPGAGDPGQATQSALVSGFLVAFLNPKLAIFMLALFSQFLQPGAGLLEKGIMVATVGITDAAWYCVLAVLVSHPAFFDRLQISSAMIDRIFGLILVVVALTVVYRALLQA
jgi:threonine/homoserine/homoserine lactone efflux protein